MKQRNEKGWLFHRPEDVHCVIYHLVVVACYATAFWTYLHPEVAGIEGPWSRAAFVLAGAGLLGWISGVNVGVVFHNQVHRPVFRSRALNLWFSRLWTFTGGWPWYFWKHQHNRVHHHELLNNADWTLPRRRADGSFENIHKYVLCHFPWRYAPALWRDFSSNRGGPHVGRTALKELAIFLPLYSIPFWIDPWMALGLWVLPHWIGSSVIMGAGMYAQHAGSVEKDPLHPVSHSNTFVSKFFNLTMFNIGYHIEHHDKGSIHWADLPAHHAAIRDDLVAQGAHIVPYGYYRAAHLLCKGDGARALAGFLADQHPDYRVDASKRVGVSAVPEPAGAA